MIRVSRTRSPWSPTTGQLTSTTGGCFGTMAFAFVARARDRGFDVSGPDPHASLPLVLRLCRGALSSHPWTTWPAPDKTFEKAAKAALRIERTAERSAE